MARKPRSDSKLDALSPEQQEQLCEWLSIDNMDYPSAKKRVYEEFGVSTSTSALCSFFGRVAVPWKYMRAHGESEQFAQMMDGKFDQASIKRAKELAFDAMMRPTPDLNAAKALLKIVGDSAKLELATQKLSLDSRKVALLEQKAAQAEKAELIVKNTQITEEERTAQMRALFGM